MKLFLALTGTVAAGFSLALMLAGERYAVHVVITALVATLWAIHRLEVSK